MNCPACASTFQQLPHDRLVIDRCPTCRGLWFDENELKSYLTHSRVGIAVERHPATLGEESPLRCPRCESPAMKACRRGGVDFLKCSDCAGLFLSASSVRELRAKSREPLNLPPLADLPALGLLALLENLF